MNERLKKSQDTTNVRENDDTTDALKDTIKWKPKWTVKEVTSFDGDPKKWVKQIKSIEAIMGQTCNKNIMESQEALTQESEMDEELCCVLLNAVLDGTT